MTTTSTAPAATLALPPWPDRATARRTFLWLRRHLILTLALTAALWAVATVLLLAAHSTAMHVKERTSPGYLGALAAHAALSDADRSAWQSFRSGQAQLIGPGQRYQDDITTAGENLEHLAQLNTTGSSGQDLLKAVSGQLVTYQGLVEQADATYREGSHQLGYAYLTYASDVLHQPGGLLSRIDQYAAADKSRLDAGLESGWLNPWVTAAVGLMALALLASLTVAQLFTAKVFRRLFNPLLLAASMLTAALAGWFLVTTVAADDHFDHARHRDLQRVAADWQRQIRGADDGSQALRGGRTAPASRGLDVAATVPDQQRLDGELSASADTQGLVVGLPLLTVAIAGLAGGGLALRLSEFRG